MFAENAPGYDSTGVARLRLSLGSCVSNPVTRNTPSMHSALVFDLQNFKSGARLEQPKTVSFVGPERLRSHHTSSRKSKSLFISILVRNASQPKLLFCSCRTHEVGYNGNRIFTKVLHHSYCFCPFFLCAKLGCFSSSLC